MTSVFIRDRREDTQRRDRVKTGTKHGIMLSQAKEYLEPSEAGRGKRGFSPRALRGNMALKTPLNLWLPELGKNKCLLF